ncbi:MAG: hypothetical protein RLZ63_561 [Pseudomonadota bacterium]|jgi:gluconokinase
MHNSLQGLGNEKTYTAVVLMGVCGSGKSTVAGALADRLNLPYVDADDLHPLTNKQKMKTGQALTDQDRWPWLEAVGYSLAQKRDQDGMAVMACSALRQAYREKIRDIAGQHILFVLLHGSKELLLQRMLERGSHFMPTSLLESQLNTLEIPSSDENALLLNISEPIATLVDAICEELGTHRHSLFAAPQHEKK